MSVVTAIADLPYLDVPSRYSGPKSCEGARFVTTAADYLYLLKGEEVCRISPKSPGSRSLKKSWPGAEWICALGDNLYLSTTKGDYLLDGKTLRGVKLGDENTKE